MTEEIRLAIATAALQGLLAHALDKSESNYSLLPPDEAASLALRYADALLEAARPRAPQAAGRLPLANAPPARDPDPGRERPSATPEEEHRPPAVLPPAAPASSRGEVIAPGPRAPPLCEAPDCPHEGRPRFVEALVDGRKRDVPIELCDVHFVGIPPSIMLEWHRAYRAALKARAQSRCRDIVQAVDEKAAARAG